MTVKPKKLSPRSTEKISKAARSWSMRPARNAKAAVVAVAVDAVAAAVVAEAAATAVVVVAAAVAAEAAVVAVAVAAIGSTLVRLNFWRVAAFPVGEGLQTLPHFGFRLSASRRQRIFAISLSARSI